MDPLMHVQTKMAQPCPTRITHPSAKLSSENVGSHELSAHRHAIANARKAQRDKEPSTRSPEGTASHDLILSMDSDGGDTSDHELGSTSDATIPNRKRHAIVVSDGNDNENDNPSPPSTQQSDDTCPKKKKKNKKHISKGM
jgi:hypothetical protein